MILTPVSLLSLLKHASAPIEKQMEEGPSESGPNDLLNNPQIICSEQKGKKPRSLRYGKVAELPVSATG